MSRYAKGNKYGLKYTDEDIIKIASQFKHKSDWKKADRNSYQRAVTRSAVYAKATAHMMPKASPYSGSYVIYAYEFTDGYAYVGLTFTPAVRHAQHMARGPVFEHIKVCPTYTHKILRSELSSPQEAIEHERYWIEQYKSMWTLLNSFPGGGLGTVQITKWTREAVIVEAHKYASKQEWIDKSQFTYRLAKREGWFEEASAHMPPRVLGVGKGKKFTEETKAKMAAAKLGTTQSAAHRHARSTATKAWWSARRHST